MNLEYVIVELTKNNISHYKNKGYKINDDTDRILINAKDIFNNENKIYIKCDYCNNIVKKSFKECKAIKGNTYCCKNCYSHMRKFKDDYGNLTYIEAPYKNKEWLYKKYIIENIEINELAKICALNTRTLLEWISKYNITRKKNFEIDKNTLEDLFTNKKLTSEEIGKLYDVSSTTVLNKIKEYNIKIPNRSEIMHEYYYNKGGLEKAREKYGSIDNRIRISCKQRNISPEEFNGFSKDECSLLRTSSKYDEWRLNVFKRDNYTCTCCGQIGGELNAHHIYNFLNNEDKRFDINNGITLCKNCHLYGKKDSFHSIYGERNNNKEEIIEFLTKRNSGKDYNLPEFLSFI